jgi:PAS domain S-box-containing protein
VSTPTDPAAPALPDPGPGPAPNGDAERRYRALFDGAPDAMLEVEGESGRIADANGQVAALFGYPREELIGQAIEVLVPERFRDAHPAQRRRFCAHPAVRPMAAGLELWGRRRDGTEFPAEISLSPVPRDGRLYVIAAVRDVTERRRVEEVKRRNAELLEVARRTQEASRLKSGFLANMSHELRTPLNSIIGFAELMYDGKVGPVSAQHREYLGDVLNSARHLLDLINDVLDLAKVEAGKMDFRPVPVDLGKVVREVGDVLRGLAAKKRLRVAAEVDPALTGVVTDPARLKQVLYNFLSNAVKFTPDEGRIAVRLRPEGLAEWKLEVEDTGPGIRLEDQKRLFVEFQQLDAGAAKQHPGTGLGLALTRRIVEAQGGRVGVRSAPGEGSAFFAVLPRTPKPAAGAGAGPAPGPAPAPRPGAPQVLVVDDDPKDRAWLVRALGLAGYAVESAETGADAIERVRAQRFDAITLDLLLPDMSGLDVLRELRAGGLSADVPVIVVTVVTEKGVAAGFRVDDVLTKPVRAEDLIASLTRAGVPPRSGRSVPGRRR